MVRLIAFAFGAFMAAILAVSSLRSAFSFITDPPKATVEHEFHKHPKEVTFASDGPFGKFDRAQLQRGFQVYKEVCSACHSMKRVTFNDLRDIGYSEGQVKTIASEWANKQPTADPKTGDKGERANLPSDKFPIVYYAGQGNPPDLSLITKARHDGPAYVYSLLTGYEEQPAKLLKHFPDAKTPDGLYYNPYFANLNLAMTPPLVADGQVTYDAGNPSPNPTVKQMAKDVSAFLVWTAEPKLENRNKAGLAVLGFLLIFTWLAWMSYQNIWADKKKR
jgi:ubiquinol-cytochrome c reductase cytochrome c1 subunit